MKIDSLIKKLSMAGDAITQNSKSVTVKIYPRNFIEKLLMKNGWMAAERIFEISPICVGTRFRVSSRSLLIPKEIFDSSTYDVHEVMAAITEHTDDLIYVIALCILNNDKKPDKSLLKFLRNIPENDFYDLLDKSLSSLGIQSFMKSMILIKGANVITARDKDASSVNTPE